jgi:CRP/FNR family cyclic AMP-dependent transcriptional regulator
MPSKPSQIRLLDIPGGTRNLLILTAVVGLIITIVASLEGGKDSTLEVDKILHFVGYAALAMVVVLALKPKVYIPALLGLIALGVTIEFIQPLNSRGFEIADMVADAVGVAVGAGIGLVTRVVLSRYRTGMAEAAARRAIRRYEAGEVIFRQGREGRHFYVVESGAVEVSREEGDEELSLGTVEAGDVVGVVSVLRGERRLVTASAVGETYLYRMNLDRLVDSAGGADQPASIVLRSLADTVKDLAEDVLENRKSAKT